MDFWTGIWLVFGVELGRESGGGLVAGGGVFAVGVVVGFEVGEEIGVGIGVDAEGLVLEHLGLAGADEGLGPGVVAGVGARGHALADAGRRYQRYPMVCVWVGFISYRFSVAQGGEINRSPNFSAN